MFEFCAFRQSVAGVRVKQSPRTLQQELAGGKSCCKVHGDCFTLPPATLSRKNLTEYAKFKHSIILLYSNQELIYGVSNQNITRRLSRLSGGIMGGSNQANFSFCPQLSGTDHFLKLPLII